MYYNLISSMNRGVISPYLLNRYSSSAIVGYSLRKLSSTATVSCRVRRSSDNVEQDVGFVGDDLDTTSLLSFIGANNGWIVKIYDQKGTGKDLAQSTASAQFQIVNAGSLITNSVGKVTALTNSGDYLVTPATLGVPNLTNGYSVFGVTEQVSQLGGSFNVDYFWTIGNLSRLIDFGVTGATGAPTNYRSNVESGANVLDSAFSTGVKILGSTFKISNHNFYINNSLVGNNTATITSYGLNPLLMVNTTQWNTATAPANQYFNEIILFNTDMTSEVTNINTNINNYYGIY